MYTALRVASHIDYRLSDCLCLSVCLSISIGLCVRRREKSSSERGRWPSSAHDSGKGTGSESGSRTKQETVAVRIYYSAT